MKIITKTAAGSEVGSALKKVVDEMNEELKKIDGKIGRAETDVSVGPSGAYVTVSICVTGAEPRRKRIIGINERGESREASMIKASNKLNTLISEKKGEIIDVFTKTISSPILGRAYTTIIAAVNESDIETTKDTGHRRERLKETLELLKSDPSTINVSRVAKIFGVSRIVIYKDLEALGFTRTSLKKSH